MFDLLVLLGAKAWFQLDDKRHDHDKTIMRLSSHPSHYSHCVNLKMVGVVVVVGIMETRLNDIQFTFVSDRLRLF